VMDCMPHFLSPVPAASSLSFLLRVPLFFFLSFSFAFSFLVFFFFLFSFFLLPFSFFPAGGFFFHAASCGCKVGCGPEPDQNMV